MADHTHIEWTDATWNPVTGCSVVSPGCTHCYAMRLAGTRLRHHPSREGLTTESKAGPVWNGQVRLNEDWLTQPLQWKRPRRIFVCAHGDLFHEAVPDAWIDQVFAVMALAPQHTFQVLTKRAARMRAYFEARRNGAPWAEAADAVADLLGTTEHPAVLEPKDIPLPNVWLGVSAEDQARADERLPDLLATPAAVRFVSAEPLLGAIDLTTIPSPVVLPEDEGYTHSALERGDMHYREGPPDILTGRGIIDAVDGPMMERLDWVIVGGESGPGARPMHPDWARRIRDDCAATGVPFFFKQWGEWKEPATPGRISFVTGSGQPNAAWPDGSICWGNAEERGGLGTLLHHVGKRAAGRLLDGVAHDAMPAPPSQANAVREEA